LTFLDGARWDVAAKITEIVNINSGGVLKKNSGVERSKTNKWQNTGRESFGVVFIQI